MQADPSPSWPQQDARQPTHASEDVRRRPETVATGIAADGTITYVIDCPPEHLPAVHGRDIEAVWHAAHAEPNRKGPFARRLFRFDAGNGATTDIALADRDARAWAVAVDRTVGIAEPYGVSICFRLIALVDLLARSRALAKHVTKGRADLPASIFRAAGNLPLDPSGRFEEAGFASLLGHRLPRPGTQT